MKSTYEAMQELREIRKKREIKMAQVVKHLHENGIDVAEKTVYGWESGQANPSIQVFMLLCRFYGVADIHQLFADEENQTDEGVRMHMLWDAYRKFPGRRL